MSGKPTNNVYFLDTCVYINYGVQVDVFHQAAVKFFCKDCEKHTSVSVITEINKFKAFMSRFSRDLDGKLRSDRATVFKNPRIIFQGYNENQMSFIEAFLKVVIGRPHDKIMEQYRNLKGLISERIEDACSKTQNTDIKQSTDEAFLKKIAYIKDIDDKQIIADAALWAQTYKYTYFCTTDKEHILSQKTPLELDITKHYTRNCLIFTHLTAA